MQMSQVFRDKKTVFIPTPPTQHFCLCYQKPCPILYWIWLIPTHGGHLHITNTSCGKQSVRQRQYPLRHDSKQKDKIQWALSTNRHKHTSKMINTHTYLSWHQLANTDSSKLLSLVFTVGTGLGPGADVKMSTNEKKYIWENHLFTL